jgi:branched-chain amino acid transport system permease protein
MKTGIIICGLVAALVAGGVPVLLGPYALSLGTQAVIFGIYAMGINVLLGHTGLVSLGHSLFLGIGGYGLAVFGTLLGWPTSLALLATMMTGCLVALCVGMICTRTRDVSFLLITLAMSQLFYGLAVKSSITGGDDGMSGLPRLQLDWLGIDLNQPRSFYLFTVAVLLLVVLFVWRLLGSPVGMIFAGIRENDVRMQALGYRTSLYKNLAFVISGAITTLAGLMQAQFTYFISAEIMTWKTSGEGVFMVIIGGARSLWGPVVGAGFFVVAKELLAQITEEYLILFGILFMIVVAVLPEGIMGLARLVATRMRLPKPSARPMPVEERR